jgi:predicted deacetylase
MQISTRIPTPAQYLLRFDDLCPTMDPARWQRFVPLIEEFALRPILAVIPDNHDPELEVAQPDPAFWSHLRALESAGATIALHGYRHLCHSKGRSLVSLHRVSEFAGVDASIQRQWIHAGIGTMMREGLDPIVWVAPRHGFDCNTLRALRKEGIQILCDGFARIPFRRDGMIWLPQQLWSAKEEPQGLWCICIHSNTATDSDVEDLRVFLRGHAKQFTSVERVLSEFQPRTLSFAEANHARCALFRFRVRGMRTSMGRWKNRILSRR